MVRLCQARQRTDRAVVSGPIQARRMKCLHFFVYKLGCPEGGEQGEGGVGAECVCNGFCLQEGNISMEESPSSRSPGTREHILKAHVSGDGRGPPE